MKRTTIYIKSAIFILLTGLTLLAGTTRSFAQGCKQVDILYNAPDCLNGRETAGAPTQDKGCKAISVCKNQPYNYSASGIWATYNWTVTGPSAVTINPNNTSPVITISWPAVGVYTLTLVVTDINNNSFTTCLTVTVKERPIAGFTFFQNNVCAGSTITFTNTTTYTGGVVYSWNFGDPASGPMNFASSFNTSHQYNNSGSYTVTLIASSFSVVAVQNTQGHFDSVIRTCCSDTFRSTVTIKPGTIKIECISTVCAGDTATYHAIGCPNPTWFPPVGGTIIAQAGDSVTIVWGNGNVQGQIQAQCPGGCIALVSVPIIPLNPQPVGNLFPCFGSITSYTLPLLPGTFYNWSLKNITNNTFYNGALSTYPDNNTVWINWSILPAGTYELTINLDNKHICCNHTGKITITPKGRFTAYNNQTICKGTAANLSVSPASGTFNWSVVPVTGVIPPTGTGPIFNPVFNITGSYTAKVWETSNAYCNSKDTQYIRIIVVNSPTGGPITGPILACPGSTNTYTVPNPPVGYVYNWTATNGTFQPGNLATISGNSVSVLFTSLPGSVTAILQRNSFPACPSPAVTLPVNIANIGTISGNQNVCVDDQFPYTLSGGNLPPGEPVQWTISPPSLGSVVLNNGTSMPTILWHGQVSGAGPWTATLTATSACGNTSTPITISKKPVFTLSQSGNVCLGGVTLTATGAGYTYVWKNPSGVIISTSNTANATTVGTYQVTVTNVSCSVVATITVVDPFGIAPVTCGVGQCTVNNNTTEVLTVRVTKPASGTFTYEWHTGTCTSPGVIVQTVTNTSLSNSYTAPASGNYCVIVKYGTCQKCLDFIVAKLCCPDINNPQITSTVRNSCNQFTFTGTNNPTPATLTWDFGDGSTAPGTSGVPISHTYAHAGIYCVKFCAGPPNPNPTNCTGNCSVPVSVIVPIEALFSYTLGCNGCINISNNSIVIPTSGAATVQYVWDFGDGSPTVTTNSPTPPTHCYTIPGLHVLQLTINYSDPSLPLTCTSTYSSNLTYTPLGITVASPVCGGQLTMMSSNPGGFASYAWNFGDTYSSYVSPTSHAYASVVSPTPFTVTLTVTDLLGNTCVATKNITVNPGISNCTIVPAYLCPGLSATLTITPVTGYTYSWEVETSPGVFSPAPGANTSNNYITNVPGFYHVVVTNTYGCQCISNRVEVKAVPKPKAIIEATTTQLCGPGDVTLSTPALPNHTYEWYANTISGTPLSTGNSYTAVGQTVTTTYILILTNEYGCKDTCQLTVVVNPVPAPPIINFSPSLCAGVPITLTVTNYASNITWNTGANTVSTVVYTAGNYTATYTDPVTGCSSSSNITVNNRPSAALFPHYCEQIKCNCRKDTIYAPRPLIGMFASSWLIQWYNPALTGTTGPFYTPAPAGTYYVVITDQNTGCKDTSQTYSITYKSCCDCSLSHWGDIVLKDSAGTNPVVLQCKNTYNLICNKPYNLNAFYICKDTICKGRVTYSLLPPVGAAITGNAPLNFTPNQSGIYQLTLYGWCGDHKCDSCLIKFNVKCVPCNCNASKWGTKTYSIENAPAVPIICMKAGDPPISVRCKRTININASYICKDSACNSAVTYILVKPSGTTTGNVPLTFIANQAGLYTVTLFGWCGGKICDSCVVRFKVDSCSQPCCPYDIIVTNPTVQLGTITNPNAIVANGSFGITGPAGNIFTEIRAEVMSYNLTSNFNNECISCKSYPYTWASIYQPGNVGIIPPKITMYYTTVPAFNPSGNGMYQNPREVIWKSGTPFALPNNINISFLLPPASVISCCELTAKICVKFTFRNKDCQECEMISCFTVLIKP